jgi:hypothetical protein
MQNSRQQNNLREKNVCVILGRNWGRCNHPTKSVSGRPPSCRVFLYCCTPPLDGTIIDASVQFFITKKVKFLRGEKLFQQNQFLKYSSGNNGRTNLKLEFVDPLLFGVSFCFSVEDFTKKNGGRLDEGGWVGDCCNVFVVRHFLLPCTIHGPAGKSTKLFTFHGTKLKNFGLRSEWDIILCNAFPAIQPKASPVSQISPAHTLPRC